MISSLKGKSVTGSISPSIPPLRDGTVLGQQLEEVVQ
jgi:hypothetical protein